MAKKKKETQYKCPRCKNQRTESKCEYCNWKGWEGPGKQLREILHPTTLKD